MLLSMALMAGFVSIAHGQIVWNETVNGDFSNNRLAPTNLSLNPGVSGLILTTGGGDVDYFHVQIGLGQAITAINLVSWSGIDQRGFMGLQAGSIFTEPAIGTNVANLLGYTHIGPAAGNLGLDLLPFLAAGAGAIGFTPPLTGTDYTFWLNQTSGFVETYQLDFVVTPEPTSILIAIPLAMAALKTRRRKA